MSGQGRRRLDLWLGASCSLAVVFALSSCTVKAPEAGTARAPGQPGKPAASQAAATSPLSAQGIIDKVGLKWKYTDPPVVVFHNPG